MNDAKLKLAETMDKMSRAVGRGDNADAKALLGMAKSIAKTHGLTARKFRGVWLAMAALDDVTL